MNDFVHCNHISSILSFGKERLAIKISISTSNSLQDKKYRILDIFFRLLKGEFVSVRQLADEYSVSGKTVSRDINEIRAYLSENEYRNGNAQIEYSHREKAYYLSMDDLRRFYD